MSEIERALDRLGKAAEVLKIKFNEGWSPVEQTSAVKQGELAELKLIKGQISNAISHIEQMSLTEQSPGKSNTANFNKDNETEEGL